MQIFASTLNCDNISKFPFPDDLKEMVSKINWEKNSTWQGESFLKVGKYSLVGNKLYYDSDLSGNVKVQESDYSGSFKICRMLVNPNNIDENNYFVNFDLLFLKGSLVEVNFINTLKVNKKNLDDISKKVMSSVAKIAKIQNSFWYKYIYLYYAYVIRFISFCLIKILGYIAISINFITTLLTPI